MEKQKWLEKIRKYITGTDVAALFGMHPLLNNIDLWEIKTGRKIEKELEDNDALKYGRDAEKTLIDMFKLDFCCTVSSPKAYTLDVSKEYSFMAGTPNAFFNSADGVKGILEIKTAVIRNDIVASTWKNKIPDRYYFQVLHYMLVHPECEIACVVAYLRSNTANLDDIKEVLKISEGHKSTLLDCENSCKFYFIPRKRAYKDLTTLLEKEIAFWDFVKRDKKPPLILPYI
jgi:predicted phage-related endonuclease